MITLAIVLLILLGIGAIIDAKFKFVPSVFLTSILLITAIVHLYNFEVGLISLAFGIIAGVFALFLYELDFIGGLADVKFLVIIGLMISTLQIFFTFMLLTTIFGIVYKSVLVYVLKYKEDDEIAFLPCLYAVYITLLLIGGMA